VAESFITLDTRELRRNLVKLSNQEVGRAMARALSRTALDIREAEQEHIERTFPNAGASAGRFIAGFRSFGAKPDSLVAYVTPRGTSPTGAPSKSEEILLQHREGATIGPSGRVERITFRGRLAIPVNIKRGARGRVGKRRTPSALTGPGGRGFLSNDGDRIFVRTGKRRYPIRLAYVLRDSADLDPTVEFYRVAQRTAEANFTPKAKREFERIRFPGL